METDQCLLHDWFIITVLKNIQHRVEAYSFQHTLESLVNRTQKQNILLSTIY